MLNLDTHILLYAVTEGLTARERELLSGQPWSISAIVLWEIAKLAELGRIEVDLDDRQVLKALNIIHVWPITIYIAKLSTSLGIKGDPADQLIAATSVVHDVPLLTRDRVLRRSKRIPLAPGLKR